MATPALGHKFRFIGTGGGVAVPITRAQLLNLYTIATTTTNQNRLITAIKLNRVQAWAQPPILGTMATPIVVEWEGNQAPSTIHSDTAVGVRPAYVDTRPPRDASNRWWSISGSNESEVLFRLTVPIGSIIDITCAIRMADDEGAVAGENGTTAAATVGKVYFNYLDGFSTQVFKPEGGVSVLP